MGKVIWVQEEGPETPHHMHTKRHINQYSNYSILPSVHTVMKWAIGGPVLIALLYRHLDMEGKSTGSESMQEAGWGQQVLLRGRGGTSY